MKEGDELWEKRKTEMNKICCILNCLICGKLRKSWMF